MTEKLSITLPEDMASEIKRRVKSGAYASTSEVLREAMRNWLRQEAEHEARMAAIRARIEHSVDDTRPRLSSDEMRTYLDALYASQGNDE